MNFFRTSPVLVGALLAGAAPLVSHAAIIPTAEQAKTLLKNRPEQDELRWKDPARGAPLKVRIVSASAQGLVVDKTLQAAVTTRTIPFSDLAGVTFAFTPVELSLHQSPDPAKIPALRVLWEARQASLAVSGSNAGETGLALAKCLRAAGDLSSFDEAAKLTDQLRAQEPTSYRRDLARAERTTLDFSRLSKSTDRDATGKMAWKITEQADNPDAMVLATAWLCDQSFEELKAIEKDNPRWMEDDAVKPARDRLYNLSLDFALYPSLFYGTRQVESSAGLKKAADIHRFTGGTLLEKGVLEDLAALYPDSDAAKETATQLAKLKKLEEDGKLSALTPKPEPEPEPEKKEEAPKEEEKKDGKPATPGEPAPSRKYNVFGE